VILWAGGNLGSAPFEFLYEDSLLRLKADPRLCVSVREGKVGDGSGIILWTCGRTDEFIWNLSQDHFLLDAEPSYCLNVREGNAMDGSDIILWTCHDNADGRWVFANGRIRYKANQHYCMGVREGKAGPGSDIILWSCDEILRIDDEL